MIYRTKARVDAWRFNGSFDRDPLRPDWAAHYWWNGHELRLSQNGTLAVPTDRGVLHAWPGSWILKHEDGSLSILNDNDFKYEYEPEVRTLATH